MPFLEEINERRAADRRQADRRKGEATVVPLASFYEQPPAPPVRKPVSVSPSFGPRISSQVSNHEIDKRINAFFDRLLAEADKRNPKTVLTDEQTVAALATESTLMFANSKPCWLADEQVKVKVAVAGE
jgi:hypothetical protein